MGEGNDIDEFKGSFIHLVVEGIVIVRPIRGWNHSLLSCSCLECGTVLETTELS